MEKLKVMIYCAGNKSEAFLDEYEMEKLLNWREIELPRIPNIGEIFDIVIDDYRIEGKVGMVYTNYCQPGNKNIKESCWGCDFGLMLSELEVIDYFGKKE